MRLKDKNGQSIGLTRNLPVKTLLVLGMTLLLAGCAAMEATTALMTMTTPDQNPGCPPTVPTLPPATEDGVWLESSDMTALLVYFEEVEACQQ